MSGVRPASVDEIVTLFVDRYSPDLEHSLFLTEEKIFLEQFDRK